MFLKRLYEVYVKSPHLPSRSNRTFQNAIICYAGTKHSTSRRKKNWFSLRENDISRIDPFAVMFTMSINIYKTHGIIVNGSRATQNGVPAYGATAFSLKKIIFVKCYL